MNVTGTPPIPPREPAAPPSGPAGPSPQDWDRVLRARHEGHLSIVEPWQSLFAPLVARPREGLVLGQLGQSLDGRIATPSGHSHYINGPAAIAHLHRLRALVDAVVIGVGTAQADDPQLTVRQVAGPQPARVVIDPSGRLDPKARLLRDDGCRRLVVRRAGVSARPPHGVEGIDLAPDTLGRLAPADILAALGERGLRRILVEGGASTVSAFVQAGCLDRLHLAIAPLIIGSGPTGLSLAPIDRLEQAWRPRASWTAIGDDLLLDLEMRRT